MKNYVIKKVNGMKKNAFIALLLGCFGSVLFAQPPGYRIAENEISAPFLEISEKNKETFKVNISRKFANKEEERLLKIAESLYPTNEEKQKNCSKPVLGNPTDVDWACGSFDGVIVPYAVTKSTVNYYLNLTDEFRKGKRQMKTSSLKYSAGVKFYPNFQLKREKFTNVYLVSMDFNWSHVCGDLCALVFGKVRTVIMDKTGKVLLVDGDKETPVMVS
jgi:hypothetical protein